VIPDFQQDNDLKALVAAILLDISSTRPQEGAHQRDGKMMAALEAVFAVNGIAMQGGV